MPRKPPQVQTSKQGIEAIFMGPALITFLSGAVLVTGMAFDRWYMTSRTNDISRYGLFQTCSYSDCAASLFDKMQSTASCSGSGASWEARSIASACLLGFGLFILFIAFISNSASALTRNMVYFFWNTVLMWLSLFLIIAGGAVQYHLYYSHLFCGVGYCTYAKELYGSADAKFCGEAWGMSTYLWFVGMCMLGANAIGCTILNVVWRERLSHTWKMRAARPTYTGNTSVTNKNANATKKNKNQSSPSRQIQRQNQNDDDENNNEEEEDAMMTMIPEGYVWDSEAGYYFSEQTGWFYDAPTQQFYDPESDAWYDPVNQVWN